MTDRLRQLKQRRTRWVGVRWMRLTLSLVSSVLLASSLATAGEEMPKTASEPNATVYIIAPTDGATVKSPVLIQFGLSGMGVSPAGIPRPGTGHHHLIIDAEPVSKDAPVPADANHLHFGGGQTEVSLELEPGVHTLQLVLADHNHVPHDPVVQSERVTITVEE